MRSTRHGGRTGGSTAATLLSRLGRKVILLEKARHPRFHIGESLLPMNLPLFERLGVLDEVRAMGVFKAGADFEADNERGYNSFAFRRAIGNSPPHAYQVWRQDFDKMLFDHARATGADAREGHEVVAVEQVDSRCSNVEVRTEEGESYRVRTQYVVDATGRDTFLSSKKRLRRKNNEHQSAAIFGHFRGAECRPGDDAGNISIYRFDHGWMWMIPLRDGVMSIGAVCRPAYLKQRKGKTVDFLLDTLKQNEGVRKRIEQAELIGGEVRVTGNYSYDSTRMGGPGWVMVGDAFAFLDPVFSSGVYLAMSGAEQAAKVVDTALREPRLEARLPAQARKAPTGRHGAVRFFHLSVQQSDHGTDLPPAAQCLADRTGCDLDAGGRSVRFAESGTPAAGIQVYLRHDGVAPLPALACGASLSPETGSAAIHRWHHASRSPVKSTAGVGDSRYGAGTLNTSANPHAGQRPVAEFSDDHRSC